MDKIFKEFDMSEKEYHHARYNLTTPSYVISQDIHEDSLECKVLYWLMIVTGKHNLELLSYT